MKVAIVGGGIGGLAAALALRHQGIEAEVYEQAPELSEIGGGLNLSPNSLKALRHLGVEEASLEAGVQPDRQFIRSWRSGRVITYQDQSDPVTQRFGAPFLMIHRADMQFILAARLPDEILHLNAACTGVETNGNGAVARFADGSEVEADAVIGADGIRSAVRESLFGPDAPRFTGCVCWRGLVPLEVALRDNPRAGEKTSWWGPHGHVVQYLVRRGELVNWVAHCDSDAWTGESWTQECDKNEVLETYADWHPSLLSLFRASDIHYKWALYDRDPLEAWGRGGVTLLGDAAHPMLPYLAQGAGMAMEDACVLGRVLGARTDDVPAALRRYEELRMARTRRAQIGSRERARVNHLPSAWARFKRDAGLAVKRRFGVDKTPLQAAWLYDYDVAAVEP